MRTNTNRAEIASIGGQYPVDTPALAKSRNGPVDKSEIQLFELGVEFEGANKIGR